MWQTTAVFDAPYSSNRSVVQREINNASNGNKRVLFDAVLSGSQCEPDGNKQRASMEIKPYFERSAL